VRHLTILFLIAGAVCLIAGSTAFGQIPPFGETTADYGIKGGFNISDFSGDADSGFGETSAKLGFIAGTFYNFQAHNNIYVSLEAYLSQKGAQATTGAFRDKMKLIYLELPVLFSYKFNPGGNTNPVVYAGPEVELLIHASRSTVSESISANDEIMNFDAGMVVGTGVELKTEKGKFLAEVRYAIGLTNIDDTGNDTTMKNRSLTFLIGYAFPVYK